ncbi:hypothetical protein DPMN_162965 [Dreissena polymorpha]|uniref:Uncharacterized protein n=1 Tax=Dreissena polymorpha TaxID=45954 RepID=A0A9D4IUS7_DREPO|nr:hypothetical protein DPMN_162965 [Dreissena polymorpha]
MAPTILLSLPGNITGHIMTSRSPGTGPLSLTGPVTGDRSSHGSPGPSSVTGAGHRSLGTDPVTRYYPVIRSLSITRSCHWSLVNAWSGHLVLSGDFTTHIMTIHLPVWAPVTDHRSVQSQGIVHQVLPGDVTGHNDRSVYWSPVML